MFQKLKTLSREFPEFDETEIKKVIRSAEEGVRNSIKISEVSNLCARTLTSARYRLLKERVSRHG